MLIEAVANPLTYRWPGGEVRLAPGLPVVLPEERALRLLQKAGGKVRPVNPAGPSLVGQIIEWDSPLFGLLQAVVLEESGSHVMVWHPLTEREAMVPKTWLVFQRPTTPFLSAGR